MVSASSLLRSWSLQNMYGDFLGVLVMGCESFLLAVDDAVAVRYDGGRL